MVKGFTAPYWDDVRAGIVYRSPTGVEFRPKFKAVPVEKKRNAKTFELIPSKIGEQNVAGGTFVQDNGMASEKISLEVYFAGAYHHDEAKLFEGAIAEYGPAQLTMPHDSVRARNVLVTKYKRTNDYVEGANRTIFKLDIRETRLGPYTDASDEVIFDVSSYLADQAMQEAMAGKLGAGSNLAKATAAVKKGIDKVKGAIGPIVSKVTDVKNAAESISTSIDTNIASLLSKPGILVSQIQAILSLPSFPRTRDVLSTYGDVVNSVKNIPTDFSAGLKDSLNVDMIFGMSSVSTMAVKAAEGEYLSREEAIGTMDEVKYIYLDYLESVIAQEEATAELPMDQRFIVDPAVYEQMYFLLQKATGQMDRMLYSLKKEATFVAEKDTSPLELAKRYYPVEFKQDPNLALAAFEKTNQSTFDEILLIEKGQEYTVLI